MTPDADTQVWGRLAGSSEFQGVQLGSPDPHPQFQAAEGPKAALRAAATVSRPTIGPRDSQEPGLPKAGVLHTKPLNRTKQEGAQGSRTQGRSMAPQEPTLASALALSGEAWGLPSRKKRTRPLRRAISGPEGRLRK